MQSHRQLHRALLVLSCKTNGKVCVTQNLPHWHILLKHLHSQAVLQQAAPDDECNFLGKGSQFKISLLAVWPRQTRCIWAVHYCLQYSETSASNPNGPRVCRQTHEIQYLVFFFYIYRQWAGYWKNPTATGTGCCHGCNTSLLFFFIYGLPFNISLLTVYISQGAKFHQVLSPRFLWLCNYTHPQTKQSLAALSSTAMSTKNLWTDTEPASGSQLHLLVRQRASIKTSNAVREGREWMSLKLPCLHSVIKHCIVEHFTQWLWKPLGSFINEKANKLIIDVS